MSSLVLTQAARPAVAQAAALLVATRYSLSICANVAARRSRQRVGGGVRHHSSHAAAANIVVDGPDSLAQKKKELDAHARQAMLWDHGISKPDAAKVLGAAIGVEDLQPEEVVCLDADKIHQLLDATSKDKKLERALFAHANGITKRFFGDVVGYRGIVEISNVCEADCYYCGIRKHKTGVHRYTIPKEEVLETALWAHEHGYGSVMLQSGELKNEKRIKYLTDVIRDIRTSTIKIDLEKKGLPVPDPIDVHMRNVGLGVALSNGELSKDDYMRLWEAGAHRYLLRIESSNPELFATLHPEKQKWEERVECLRRLKKIGFQIGSGVMIGLPGQSLRDLARDIEFFREEEFDMIGMGPYITEEGTPATEMWKEQFGITDPKQKQKHMENMLQVTTRMVAICRLTMGNVNIAATTALQAINPVGREMALQRGANILMPILTPTKYRVDYQLYEGKPCISDTADQCRNCLNIRVTSLGKKTTLTNAWNDPPSQKSRIVGKNTPVGTRFMSTASAAAVMQGPAAGGVLSP